MQNTMQASAGHSEFHGVGSPLPGQNPKSAGAPTLMNVIWRRKGIVVFFLLCGLGGGYAYFTQQDEVFRASSVVEVFQQQSQLSTGSAIESVQDLAPGVGFIQAEMTSDQVLDAAVEIGQLASFDSTPADPKSVVGLIRQKLVLSPAIKGAESKERSIVLVSFESTDPLLATAVVNSVVKAYENYVNGRHEKMVESVVGFFKESRVTVLPKLEELEAEYSEFRGKAPLEWTSSGEAVNPFREDAIRLEENLRSVETESRQLTSKLRLIEEASKDQTSAVAILREVQYLLDDVSGVREMQQKIVEAPNDDVELQTKLMGLRVQSELLATQFAANHPQRQVIDNELVATEKALREIQKTRESTAPAAIDFSQREEDAAKSLLRSYVSGLRKKRQLVEEDAAELSERLESVRTKAHQLIAFENDNASFLRRISRYQEMLESFDSQLERSDLRPLNSGLEVHVLQPAGMGMLVGPLLARTLLAGGMIGLMLGGALGWVLDWSERTFRSPDEIAETLSLPILAHLPLMVLRKKKKTDDDARFAMMDRSITVIHDPHSPSAEAIRAVRTSLFATSSKKAEYQVIQVTSALPGDGKSTMVANLAASVAGANKRVIIVDADLRRPTQASLFGIESELGLTSVLNGDCSLQEAIVETQIPGLFILTTGPKPNNPAEALMLPDFGQTLDDLRTDFDVILVDTPPVLAVTDACNVANHVDGVMFVMRIGRNVKPMSKRAITMLRGLHVNVIGVIVNAIGDSGYSATYANAWSTSYGGQPGSEYGYGYYRYGSDRYLNASKGQSVTVRGRSASENDRQLLGASSVAGDEVE